MILQAIDYNSENFGKDFAESLKETGFGVIKNHPISKNKVQTIYQNWANFFNTDEKNNFIFNKDTQDGFFPSSISEVAKNHTVKDIKEYFHIYPWGQIPNQLRHEILDYYDTTILFAKDLLQKIEDNTPENIKQHFSQPLTEMIENSSQSLLRVLHYPPMKGDEEPGAIRAAAHEDINLITILPASNEPGLQVKTKSGEWIDVPSDFGTLIVNIGDMLQETTQGYYPSTSHRVINPTGKGSDKSRISLPLFLHPRPDVILSERYTAQSYLQERLQQLGVK
ncbi:2OG-Fe(II) oxygenase [Paraphotobacterium marinum]|uniref:2-oxoglutarate-dependent ethylene/succinate-forming enzyme n=1 Tax=Paraphotobacterium marinum TaxID=1755811 RepID=A0A220VHI0_9GAMM|nr:2OG-Fe(II) oxygenase family protein [Paraphotobacterium marinum]ASK79825.1 2OG-Fe(II) oxygenase [Paraphotobacterium marinum]